MKIKKFSYKNSQLFNQALKIRHEVFVIGQKCPEDLEYEFEEESTHFLLLINKKPVATARYRMTEKGCKLERFAVLKIERGKGYGLSILKKILKDLSFFNGIIYLHAQIQVVKFYEKQGFKKYGNKFKEAGIVHYKMKINQMNSIE